MRQWTWCVILRDGSTQSGTVESFDEAVKALRAWVGGGQPPELTYSITPNPKS